MWLTSIEADNPRSLRSPNQARALAGSACSTPLYTASASLHVLAESLGIPANTALHMQAPKQKHTTCRHASVCQQRQYYFTSCHVAVVSMMSCYHACMGDGSRLTEERLQLLQLQQWTAAPTLHQAVSLVSRWHASQTHTHCDLTIAEAR